jgi:hypothetical protein
MSIQFPDKYFDFLSSKRRKHQNKILENFSLVAHKLSEVLYRAWNEYDFTFSNYTFEKKPKGLENKDFLNCFICKKITR